MQEILFGYKLDPTTWAYVSALMMVGIYFKFRRFWSVRNLDLVALISFSPGLLLIYHGLLMQDLANRGRRLSPQPTWSGRATSGCSPSAASS